MPDDLRRKLAVILHADVVGSTALVQQDESAAHRRIRDAFRQFTETIESYGGSAHEIRGDALVAEFARASDAVSAALAFQSAKETRNHDLDRGIQLTIRVGISLGEVVVADGTVTGVGVVLAQRLEQLAEPGGIVVQGTVSETVPTRLPFEFQSLGDRELKGFDQPVRAFVATLRPGELLPAPEALPAPANEPEQAAEILSDKPSIAVLPFANLSGDSEQEYFSDGVTEDIITNLSRFRDLFVIARNSTFAYKGKPVKIQDVSKELGVRYVLEGSVQRSKDQIRITAQLIEGSTGRHLWAKRYQRQVEDIFALQDEVVEMIVGALASGYGGRLRKAWQRQTRAIRPQSIQAFDCFMRGIDACDRFTMEDNQRGRELLEEAVRLDPSYAKAYAKLAWTHILDAIEGWRDDYEGAMAKAQAYATEGIECDDSESWAHWALAVSYFYEQRQALALSQLQEALDLNPNDADVLSDFGLYLSYAGRAEEGLEVAKKAMRLNPHHPRWYKQQLGQIYFDAHRYEDAVTTLEAPRSLETTLSGLYLAASHAALHDSIKAREAVRHVLELDPDATVGKWTNVKMAPYTDVEDLEHFRGHLHVAGLPG